jgi:hypothetical protein
VDPLESKYAGWSSYNYCNCSPVVIVDPTGKGGWYFDTPDKKGNSQMLFYKGSEAQFKKSGHKGEWRGEWTWSNNDVSILYRADGNIIETQKTKSESKSEPKKIERKSESKKITPTKPKPEVAPTACGATQATVTSSEPPGATSASAEIGSGFLTGLQNSLTLENLGISVATAPVFGAIMASPAAPVLAVAVTLLLIYQAVKIGNDINNGNYKQAGEELGGITGGIILGGIASKGVGAVSNLGKSAFGGNAVRSGFGGNSAMGGRSRFIVTEGGSVIIEDATLLAKSLTDAGITKFSTQSSGVGYNMPNGVQARLMQPSGLNPLRLSFGNGAARTNAEGLVPQKPFGMSPAFWKTRLNQLTHVNLK